MEGATARAAGLPATVALAPLEALVATPAELDGPLELPSRPLAAVEVMA